MIFHVYFKLTLIYLMGNFYVKLKKKIINLLLKYTSRSQGSASGTLCLLPFVKEIALKFNNFLALLIGIEKKTF